MFRSLFGGGGGNRARGFRPRQNGNGIHFLFPLVVGMASGYYIFDEPLKQAVIEVKAKEAREKAKAAEGGRNSGSSSDGGGSRSGSGSDGVDGNKPPGAVVGSGVNT